MNHLEAIGALVLCGLLVCLSYFDALERRLPNWLVLGVALLALASTFVQSICLASLAPFASSGIGLLLSAGPALILSCLYRLLRGADGFGAGDIKLLAALGLYFGPVGIFILPLASVLALGYFLAHTPFKKSKKAQGQSIAFGPFISLAVLILLMACL